MEILNQLVQVNESTLHLLLRSLSLHTIAVDLVHPDQRTATRLQLLDDLQDQVHPFFHSFFKPLPFTHSFLKVDPFPLIVQGLQPIVNLLQNRFVTASDWHDERSSRKFENLDLKFFFEVFSTSRNDISVKRTYLCWIEYIYLI